MTFLDIWLDGRRLGHMVNMHPGATSKPEAVIRSIKRFDPGPDTTSNLGLVFCGRILMKLVKAIAIDRKQDFKTLSHSKSVSYRLHWQPDNCTQAFRVHFLVWGVESLGFGKV